MSDNIAGDSYTHSDTKREKQIPIKRRTYTRNKQTNKQSIAQLHAEWAQRACFYACKLQIIYPYTETNKEKDRETNVDQEMYLYSYK